MEKINGYSLNLEKQNIDRIKELFPEAVEEGKINFDMLRAMLGDEIDDSREKYQFTWNGKAKAIKMAQTPSSTTLRPCKEKSKDWDTTENLYIEGDNLEVLKQLQKTYYGKIKLIYIDPPYNTGNDFVYNDSFSNTIENYKEQTNQAASSNPESNGRFHTDWLNMMYPRLLLAKNLLSDDGIICISIDENEQANLKKICEEVFGEQNFVDAIIWERAFAPKNDAKYFSESHDYIIIFAKNINNFQIGKLPRTEEANARYKNPDNDPRGPWTADNMTVKTYTASYDYPIVTPNGRIVSPSNGRCWFTSKERMEKLISEGRVYFGADGGNTPRLKRYLSDVQQGMTPTTIWKLQEVGHNQEGRQELKKLFDGKGYFDGPKPLRLLSRILEIANTSNDSFILDFFSGSASTAHAVMKLNSKDGGNRKFIMVQLPELCAEKSEAYKAGYKNICEIGEERICRAGEQIKSDWEKEHSSDELFCADEKFTTDIGFKVFKLDSTNVNEWDPNMKFDEKELAMRLSEVFKSDRNKEDILYEIMLKYGVFDRKVEEIIVNDKTMYRVGERYMIVCLEDSISVEEITSIGKLSPKTVIVKESSFKDDNEKINALTNLKKMGVEDIKCI